MYLSEEKTHLRNTLIQSSFAIIPSGDSLDISNLRKYICYPKEHCLTHRFETTTHLTRISKDIFEIRFLRYSAVSFKYGILSLRYIDGRLTEMYIRNEKLTLAVLSTFKFKTTR